MYKNDYEYYLARVRDRHSVWKLIDHEDNAYLSFEDTENGWLYSMWFDDNGHLVHETDCRI